MGIIHKFREVDFGSEFKTKNSILVNTPYKPEILFIGTFNPMTNEDDNMAEFFYGRNWFWPILFNIFHYKNITLDKQRKFYKPEPNPTLSEIFDFMKIHKITFADLITSVLDTDDEYCIAKNKIIYNKNCYDLINDGHLSKLNNLGKVQWNETELIDYLSNNKTIKNIYFTRKYTKPFSLILDKIEKEFKNRELRIKYLFTPSGQGIKGKPRINSLVNQWKNSQKEDYDNLEQEWLNK